MSNTYVSYPVKSGYTEILATIRARRDILINEITSDDNQIHQAIITSIFNTIEKFNTSSVVEMCHYDIDDRKEEDSDYIYTGSQYEIRLENDYSMSITTNRKHEVLKVEITQHNETISEYNKNSDNEYIRITSTDIIYPLAQILIDMSYGLYKKDVDYSKYESIFERARLQLEKTITHMSKDIEKHEGVDITAFKHLLEDVLRFALDNKEHINRLVSYEDGCIDELKYDIRGESKDISINAGGDRLTIDSSNFNIKFDIIRGNVRINDDIYDFGKPYLRKYRNSISSLFDKYLIAIYTGIDFK